MQNLTIEQLAALTGQPGSLSLPGFEIGVIVRYGFYTQDSMVSLHLATINDGEYAVAVWYRPFVDRHHFSMQLTREQFYLVLAALGDRHRYELTDCNPNATAQMVESILYSAIHPELSEEA